MKTLHRKILLTLTILYIAFVTIACSNQSTATEKEKDEVTTQSKKVPEKIVLGYQVSPNGELLAKALGLLEKKYPDTKIEWVKFEAGRDVNNAIASGSIDFGLVGTPPAAIGIASKLPYKVYYLHDIIGESEALVVKQDSEIQSLKDLKGKKIATTFNSTSHFSLLGALKAEGMDPKKGNIQILDMQPPDIYAAWQRGDIDGAYIWQPMQSKLVADNGKVIIHSGELAEKGIITAEMGIVRNDFVEKYPEIVEEYISILDESVKYYHENPEKSAELLSTELGLTPEKSLETMKQIVWLDESKQKEYYEGPLAETLKETADYLVEQKSITNAPDIKTFEQSLLQHPYQ
ncbi:aliphatic sulfonate ABC transporter substrate-binding protein [Bacillus thermocopriae]|uniref:Aliphatic sulfonate ABC transporter substrate-binding protein n=2 Tax=Neobacillus thermocopriae TaxID=1215031 RepID=A0A6B3TPI6_9BACI|nr:aliphatic sulfonate ABC transporter substrate-binding protein [Neobacillus thermocopriae]NEX78723.1 aliphatic sulfonate ABC transporter substrate-binding protein [Neobacillus thermocopriae]